jgi:ectoine hydroxylase-related dioxygenase (phytanoyl-CoA dioxygenase family)
MKSLEQLHNNGFQILYQMFDETALKDLNQVAATWQPTVGFSKTRGWLSEKDLIKEFENKDLLKDIDWKTHWANIPANLFIDDVIIPALSAIANQVFDGKNWSWQKTNRYVISNYPHEGGIYPHFDAPYLNASKPHIQMAKYLDKGILSITFMIPLITFTPLNGGTGIVPGTHKFIYDTTEMLPPDGDKNRHVQFFKDNYIQPIVPLGSLFCFYGNCMHSVMPNESDTVRRGIILRAIREDALDEMRRLGVG